MKIGYLMQAGVQGIRQRQSTGPANHVRQVVTELRGLGHQVRFLGGWDGKIWKSDDMENFEPVDVPWYDWKPFRLLESIIRRFQTELKLPYFAFFESLHFALACYQEFKGFDLLYERIGWMAYGSGLAARWLKIPLVLEENGNHLTVMETLGIAPKGLQRRLSISLMKRAVHNASHIIASGDGWRDHFIERWNISPRKITTVENGTMLVELLERNQLQVFQSSEDPGNEITLVYLGGFYAWQGVPILIRAFAKASAQKPGMRLTLIGAGQSMDEAKQLVSELDLQDLVTFTGMLSVDEFAPQLAKAHIGLSPYCGWVEFSGLKIFDYKAAGLAVIASGENGRPATIRHEKTGWITPPCDEDALCKAIVELASNPNLRRQLGQNARIEAEKVHGWKHTVQHMEKIFLQLVSK